VLRLTEVDHGVHGRALALQELDLDDADAATALAERGHQPHGPGIRRPEEARRHGDRFQGRFESALRSAERGAGGVGAQRQHRATVHLGADGPMLVELAFKNARVPAGVGLP
jgi:hypothetical protein